MKNNPNFTEELNATYLSLLAKYDEPERFDDLYQKTAANLFMTVDDTTDRDKLEELKVIIDYKKKQVVEEGMRR